MSIPIQTHDLLPCRIATLTNESCGLTPTSDGWKQHNINPLLSIARVKRSDRLHTSQYESGVLSWVYRTCSSHPTRSHVRLHGETSFSHLCTAPVPQRPQSLGIMFRHYQWRSVIFLDNKPGLFQGSRPLSLVEPGISDLFRCR